MKLILTGGRARGYGEKLPEWKSYDEAVVATLDTETRTLTKQVAYISPPEVCADDTPAIVFKAAHLLDNVLYVCTQTEILGYNASTFEKVFYLSHRLFNDAHHVRCLENGSFLVANTGLDVVFEIARDGQIVHEWGVLGELPWKRFGKDRDYRKVATTKPHDSHPNYTFTYNDEIWVTRFVQKDAVCLTDPAKRIDIGVGNPHDGRVSGDHVYFTTTNANIVQADLKSSQIINVYDLNEMGHAGDDLGWCRGIEIIAPGKAIVGFSEFRQTKIKKNIEWVKSRVMKRKAWGQHPTRVTMYDLEKGEIAWECSLDNVDMHAIFSVSAIWD